MLFSGIGGAVGCSAAGISNRGLEQPHQRSRQYESTSATIITRHVEQGKPVERSVLYIRIDGMRVIVMAVPDPLKRKVSSRRDH